MPDNPQNIILEGLFAMDIQGKAYAWQPFKDGVDIYPIYQQGSGQAAALLRYQSGATVPVHRHGGYEHILILAGSQTDGQQVYEPGTLLISIPGSCHRVASQNGCIVLAIWQAPVEFLS